MGRALAALHREPAFDWTLDLLAQEAGISRSALTEKFTRFIGQAPMAYLTDWRLELGAEALRSTSRSVQRVALDSGYESEAAFNRAFKRRFSVPPARYRREARAAVADEDSARSVTRSGGARLTASASAGRRISAPWRCWPPPRLPEFRRAPLQSRAPHRADRRARCAGSSARA